MKKINLKHIAVVICLTLASNAWAQFGSLKPKLPTGGAEAQPGRQQTVSVNRESFERELSLISADLLGARILLLQSQAKLAQALGLKNEALIKSSESLASVQGASSDPGARVAALKDSKEVSKRAQDEMQQKMASSDEVSGESRQAFAEGFIKFVEAVIAEKNQLDAVKKLAADGKELADSANLAQKAKVLSVVKPAFDIATMVPGDIKEGYTSYKLMREFAKSKNIDLPTSSDAMKALEDTAEP